MPPVGDDPVAEPRCAAGSRSSNIIIIDEIFSGECRVGRTLLRGGPSSPARGADPRRRQHRPIPPEITKSEAARRPPIATPSAAQPAGAARHPSGRSRADRAPRRGAAASRSSNIRSIFPETEFAKKNWRRRPAGGASGSVGSRVAPLTDGDGSARPSRARGLARVWLIGPTKLLIFQCRLFGDDPVAQPRGAAGSRSSNNIMHQRSPRTGIPRKRNSAK